MRAKTSQPAISATATTSNEPPAAASSVQRVAPIAGTSKARACDSATQTDTEDYYGLHKGNFMILVSTLELFYQYFNFLQRIEVLTFN